MDLDSLLGSLFGLALAEKVLIARLNGLNPLFEDWTLSFDPSVISPASTISKNRVMSFLQSELRVLKGETTVDELVSGEYHPAYSEFAFFNPLMLAPKLFVCPTFLAAPETTVACPVLNDAISALPEPLLLRFVETLRRREVAPAVDGAQIEKLCSDNQVTELNQEIAIKLTRALDLVAYNDSFEECLLYAPHEDSQTLEFLLVGQIAGAIYGLEGLPLTWTQLVEDKAEIYALAVDLQQAVERSNGLPD